MHPPEPAPFVDLLNHALRTVRRPDGSTWTSGALAAELNELGVQASASQMREFRRGSRLDDPRRSTLWGYSVVLNLPFDYWFGPVPDKSALPADPLLGEDDNEGS